MLALSPDPQFPRMLSRASAAFRKLCGAAIAEIRQGDPAAALQLVEALLASKPMGIIDRRCMHALQLALGAIINLRAAGQPRKVDLQHFAGITGRISIREGLVEYAASTIRRQVVERTTYPVPCPNCHAAAPVIGWTRLVQASGAPHDVRFLLNSPAIVAAIAPGEALSELESHIVVAKALILID